MSYKNNLLARLKYYGGNNDGRMINAKQWSLKAAMSNSYQAQTIQLEDKRRFRCLINPNKETPDQDNKILSVLYDDVCLNKSCCCFKQKTQSGNIESLGIKPGDTFLWEQTNTHWIAYLQYIEELSYFKAQIRKCATYITVNDKKYWVCLQTVTSAALDWVHGGGYQSNAAYIGEKNYTLSMIVTKDKNTSEYFHRYQKIKIKEPFSGKENTWKVSGVNTYYGDGILQIGLVEEHENTLEEESIRNKKNMKYDYDDSEGIYIDGLTEVDAFSSVVYEIKNNSAQGEWFIKEDDEEETYISGNDTIKLDINKSKGSFLLIYKINKEDAAYLNVTVNPF